MITTIGTAIAVAWLVVLLVIARRIYRRRRPPVPPPPPIDLDAVRREQLRALAAAEYHQRKKDGEP